MINAPKFRMNDWVTAPGIPGVGRISGCQWARGVGHSYHVRFRPKPADAEIIYETWLRPAAAPQLVGYWVPNQFDPAYCAKCGAHEHDHNFDGIGYACQPITQHAQQQGYHAPIVSIGLKPVHERSCRKCRNKSLRQVTHPDTMDTVAFCRLCGTEEPL